MKKLISALACILTVLFVISCGSTPEAEPEPTVKDAAEEIKKDVEETVDFSAANKSLLALTEAARQSSIEFGSEKYFPDGFSVAETKYTSIKNNVETDSSKDYAAALKEKADALSLANENQKAYDDGKKALEEYSAFGADKDGATLLAKANEALAAYNDVVNKGLKANAARERQSALEAKRNADKVRAGVAKKEEYKKASEIFKKADSSYVTANIEGAFNGYKTAKETYSALYEEIKEKRAAAQALIDAAKQKVADSENYAKEADSIAPLEGVVAGIEAEDAVLLEEDNFANPEDAVINVEDGTTAKTAEKVAETAIAVENVASNAVESVIQNSQNTSEAK